MLTIPAISTPRAPARPARELGEVRKVRPVGDTATKIEAMIVRGARPHPWPQPARPETASDAPGTTPHAVSALRELTSPRHIATISITRSGLRCSFTRLVAMSSPDNIGQQSSNRNANSESTGNALMLVSPVPTLCNLPSHNFWHVRLFRGKPPRHAH